MEGFVSAPPSAAPRPLGPSCRCNSQRRTRTTTPLRALVSSSSQNFPKPERRRIEPNTNLKPDVGAARPGGGLAQENNHGLFSVDPSLVSQDPEENLRGFVKTRGSLVPGEEFVIWWTGDIHSLNDDKPSEHLFSFEGYNIGRMARVDGGWRMLTREVGLYKDPKTGEILDVWTNPETGTSHEVVHVWNDPVNQQFMLRNGPDGSRAFKVPTTSLDDDIYWHAEIFLRYPSPLPRAEFPDKSASDLYQSAELFQFYTKAEDLERDLPSTPCQISWVRVGQWLPWMDMGDKPGKLVYHCRGKKLDNGFASLPEHVQDYIQEKYPEYNSAPYDFTQPNETSWSYYKKLLEQKGAPRADGTVARREPEPVEAPFAEPNTQPEDQNRVFTSDELAKHDGTDRSKPIYLSILGQVYDVTSGRRHYEIGQTYNCLTGKDCTKDFLLGALPSGRMSKPGQTAAAAPSTVDLNNLTEDQRSDVENWQSFFSKQYPRVGHFPSWKSC